MDRDENFWAPGTLVLEAHGSSAPMVLHPTPSDDPNDPLNWSTLRKAANFGLVCFYVLFTFVILDCNSVAYVQYKVELDVTYGLYNTITAVNFAGLAIGSLFILPFAHKYGRRPVYLFSSVVQFVVGIWQANIHTREEFIASSLLGGLGGAVSETIVQMTIADVFFIHQHATLNGIFLLMQSTGAYLGPLAGGFIVSSQGWRWMWWWCAIFLGVNVVLVLFFFEESKYVPVLEGEDRSQGVYRNNTAGDGETKRAPPEDTKNVEDEKRDWDMPPTEIDPSRKVKSYRERLALVTKTETSMSSHLHRPFKLLFAFPAVAYAAVTYGTMLAWFSVISSVTASQLLNPPYNFDSEGVGLMRLPPFVGSLIGTVIGGPVMDRSMLWLARRNGGIFEPEMRLYMAIPGAFIATGGILMYGLGLSHQAHWMVLAVGFGIYAVGFILTGDVALTYLIACYADVIGDALVGVVFIRNIISVIIMFVLTPWIENLGVQNTFISVAMIALAIFLIPVPMIIWGKRWRIMTAARYKRYSQGHF